MITQLLPRFQQIPCGLSALCCYRNLLNNNASFTYCFTPSHNTRYYAKYETPGSSTDLNPMEKQGLCKQFTTIGKLFNGLSPKSYGGDNKVSIIGLDDIGTATVFALLTKEITNNICVIDMNEDVLHGEHMDWQGGSLFLKNPKIVASKDPAATSNSKVCIVTTGTYKGRDEDDHEYVARNTGILRAIVPPLAKYSPETIFIVASDPVDILCYATWRLSGAPKYRVIGTGTIVDTVRFRHLLADKFGVSPECCYGDIIGQHGEYSVPVWSNVNIAGVRLHDVNPQAGTDLDPEMWKDLYKAAVNGDDQVRQLKGTVSWSIALAVAEICKAIFSNSNTVIPVSTYAKGEHSIRDDVFLSLPCVIGRSGVTDIIRQTLTEMEGSLLRRSAENISQVQDSASKMIS